MKRLLCTLGFHQWGRWRFIALPKMVNIRTGQPITEGPHDERRCERCGRIQMDEPGRYS